MASHDTGRQRRRGTTSSPRGPAFVRYAGRFTRHDEQFDLYYVRTGRKSALPLVFIPGGPGVASVPLIAVGGVGPLPKDSTSS